MRILDRLVLQQELQPARPVDIWEPPARLPAGGLGLRSNLFGEMAVTLAKRPTQDTVRGPRRRIQLMEKFVIEGGVPLSGTMVPAGNKNGALPILAACLLTEDEVVVRNVPRIRDVDAMLAILGSLGVSVEWRGANELALCSADVHQVDVAWTLQQRAVASSANRKGSSRRKTEAL